MGWTGYINGETATEAIEHEMTGCEVLAKSGAWRLWRNEHGHVGLTYFLTDRFHGQLTVKGISAASGPHEVPTRNILNKYLALTPDRERTDYESEWLDRCATALDRKDAAKNLVPGDSIRLDSAIYFSDGVHEDGFAWQGKYLARRNYDASLVRLPKNWRSRVVAINEP